MPKIPLEPIKRLERLTAWHRGDAGALGVIKSPMHPVETYAPLDALHPIGHMGEISDVVGAVLYLEEAGFVTGEILHVDGGQSAGH
jgi:NAD(P)-dependent dehydrogenase (short-subunit alcohol dehydrogenase family)